MAIKKSFALLAASLLSLASGMAGAQSTTPAAKGDDAWQFSLRPYLWLPTINGSLLYTPSGGGAPEAETGPNNYLSHLNMAAMVSGEARKGDWAIISDLIYLNFSGENSKVKSVGFGNGRSGASADLGTTSSLKGVEFMLAASRTVSKSSVNTTEVVGGFRYLGIEASTNWQLNAAVSAPGGGSTFANSGGISQRADLYSAIVGVRGKVRLGEGSKWVVPYYLDVGAGNHNTTWQAMTGLSYQYGWGDVSLAYRHVYYDQSGDRLVQSLSFSGPALGVSFNF